MKKYDLIEKYCGIIELEHAKDCYVLYYDNVAQYAADGNHRFKTIDGYIPILGFKGICGENSNSLRISTLPKGYKIISEGLLYYNKDGYVQHCNKFHEYEEWLTTHNKQRYVDTTKHGQKIDGKNLLHCRRLIDMCIEIATEKTIKVKRPNADYLLSIRRGEVDLDTIINQAEKDILLLDEVYAKCNLPEKVDDDLIIEILKEIRGVKSEKS